MAQFFRSTKDPARPWIVHWYRRYERPLSSISLVGGFVFDSLTLTRADQLRENLWIVMHLAAVAACIVLIHREAAGEPDDTAHARKHFWLLNVMQFLFGGLLSTYIVFYFRSATLAASWPFMLILIGAFVANDRLKQHRERLVFQVGLFFLSVFAFAIFVLPIVLHTIGTVVFLASGIMSLLAICGFLALLEAWSKEALAERNPLIVLIAAIFVCVNAMYFMNLIPPLPLALKHGEIVHGVTRTARGGYVLDRESRSGIVSYFDPFPDFHETPGRPAYAFSAVFSPSELNLTIVHEWQFYDDTAARWITRDRVPLRVVGGRGGGFRTYSAKSNPAPGYWRVNVKTEYGEVIGRIRFRVVAAAADSPPPASSP